MAEAEIEQVSHVRDEEPTWPPTGGSHHPDEETDKELRGFDDLVKGLPNLAEQVFYLANALPAIREELESFSELKQDVKDIKALIREAVDAGVAAAAGYEKMQFEHEQSKAELAAVKRHLETISTQLQGVPCLSGKPCVGGNSSTIPAPPSDM